MSQHKLGRLLHPAFLISISILLINDVSLKYQFPNWFTGKLSDFSGVFAFSFFLFVMFPRFRVAMCLFCVSFFSWWKSPLSQPLINFATSFLPVTRVVDYTDLIAFVMLPVSWRLTSFSRPTPSAYPVWMGRGVAVVALFVFCNTSLSYHTFYRRPEDLIDFNREFASRKSKNEILAMLKQMGLTYREDSIINYQVFKNDFYLRVYDKKDSSVRWQPVPQTSDTALFVRKVVDTYYVIPTYIIEGDTLKNVEIVFYEYENKKKNKNKKTTIIKVQTFQSNRYTNYDLHMSKLARKYKRHFKALFE